MTSVLGFSAGMAPATEGQIRTLPEDFRVIEDLGFAPRGSGEHVFLRISKRSANTDWVARQIAAFAGVSRSAVSYAGLKDRRAVAEQWFSVHLPRRDTEPDWSACGGDSFAVLEQRRHLRKLRRGVLRGNGFQIVIRNLRGDRSDFEQRLHHISVNGVPNYYGPQRFGHQGDNLVEAQAMFSARKQIKDRYKRGLYLSAARSHLFNQVLSRRVAEGTWNQALVGDVMMLEGCHSVFPVEHINEQIRNRVAALDIHPTGPLWGVGEPMSCAEVLALEQTVAAESPLFSEGLRDAELKQERRALRVRMQGFASHYHNRNDIELRFWLPAGVYATCVLRELITAV